MSLIDENAHAAPPAAGRGSRYHLLRRPLSCESAVMKLSPESASIFFPDLDVGAFGANHNRHHRPRAPSPRRSNASGEPVDAQDAAEDIDQHRLDLLVRHEDAKRRSSSWSGARASADVEKIGGRRRRRVLDDVHRRHRETGAVDHAPHAPVELDVAQHVASTLRLRAETPRRCRAARRRRGGGRARCHRG